MPDAIDRQEIVGVLLAGGAGRRMGGGDKSLRTFEGETLLARIIRRLRPQVGRLVLNANGDPTRFKDYGLAVVADVIEGYAGPLAGVLTGMEWARTNVPEARYVVTVPTDIPFLPLDLVPRLAAALVSAKADIACASSGGRDHPVPALWKISLAERLHKAMVEDGMRKVDGWTAGQELTRAKWPVEPVDPFFNVNREEDLERAAALAGREIE
jgi:molybdopterin-guanine dinucleotide biosynthesis protein A